MEALSTALGDEVQDADEETFDLFSQCPSLPDLGMIDPRAVDITLSIAGRDFEVQQSPGLLQSKREGGTTGAVVWQTCVKFAEWLAIPTNPLFKFGILDASSTVLELGSGISGIVPCVLALQVGEVIATDQQHLLKLLRENVSANTPSPWRQNQTHSHSAPIKVFDLDWEEDDISAQLTAHDLGDGVEIIVACDCVFNYALVEPFVQACVEICQLRRSSQGNDRVGPVGRREEKQTVCVIAQQLRQSDVFETWLRAMMEHFRVWRLSPSDLQGEGTGIGGGGFVVHVAVLR